MTKKLLAPYIAVAIGVLSVSTSAIFVRLAVAPSSIIANYRLLIAVLLMAPLIIFKYRNEFKHISKRDWYFSIAAGIFLALHFILWFESLNHTSHSSTATCDDTTNLRLYWGLLIF